MRKGKKDKIIVGMEVLLLCMIAGILRINATSSNPPSSEVSYNKNSQTNVQGAINDLYSKANYGNATANDILSGKKALVGGKEVVGTFTCTVSASQTPGDAAPENIDEGKIAWVNGEKIVGTRISLATNVELGDYISYTPIKAYYTVSKADSYHDYEPQIKLDELNLWRVIQKNTDGTVELVSNSVSNILVSFGGGGEMYEKYAYKYYIATLNKIAKSYETEGITVSSRHMGYDAEKSQKILSLEIETDFPEDAYLDNGYETDIALVRVATGGLKANSSYFLASRGTKFNVRIVDRDGVVVNDENVMAGSHGHSVRPIVVLRSDLKITGGNGTEESPYTLGV